MFMKRLALSVKYFSSNFHFLHRGTARQEVGFYTNVDCETNMTKGINLAFSWPNYEDWPFSEVFWPQKFCLTFWFI